jgi:hypothetical protein
MKTELNTPASRRLKAYKASAAKLTESYKIYGNFDYVTTWQQQRYPKPDVLSRPDLTRSTDKQKYFVDSLDQFPCKKWIDAEKTGARNISSWYADNMQHELITPAVVFIRNPKALNDDDRDNAGAHIQFMPAIYWSDCDSATVYADVYDCMNEAAHAANRYAERVAEEGREEDAKYRAEEDIKTHREMIHELNREALPLIAELKAHPEGYAEPICKVIKNTLNDIMYQRAKAFQNIEKLEDNYWNAISY